MDTWGRSDGELLAGHAAADLRTGFTHLLPLLSPHLPFLLLIGFGPYEDLLDAFWCVLQQRTGSAAGESCPPSCPTHRVYTSLQTLLCLRAQGQEGWLHAGASCPEDRPSSPLHSFAFHNFSQLAVNHGLNTNQKIPEINNS